MTEVGLTYGNGTQVIDQLQGNELPEPVSVAQETKSKATGANKSDQEKSPRENNPPGARKRKIPEGPRPEPLDPDCCTASFPPERPRTQRCTLRSKLLLAPSSYGFKTLDEAEVSKQTVNTGASGTGPAGNAPPTFEAETENFPWSIGSYRPSSVYFESFKEGPTATPPGLHVPPCGFFNWDPRTVFPCGSSSCPECSSIGYTRVMLQDTQ